MKPVKPTRKKQEKETCTQARQQNLLDSLGELPHRTLLELRRKIDDILAEDVYPVGKDDISIEYEIRLRTSDGVAYTNAGAQRLNGIRHPRLLAKAPSKFATAFSESIFDPVNAAAYDLFDEDNDTGNSLLSLDAHTTEGDALPGFPMLPPADLP